MDNFLVWCNIKLIVFNPISLISSFFPYFSEPTSNNDVINDPDNNYAADLEYPFLCTGSTTSLRYENWVLKRSLILGQTNERDTK